MYSTNLMYRDLEQSQHVVMKLKYILKNRFLFVMQNIYYIYCILVQYFNMLHSSPDILYYSEYLFWFVINTLI